MNNKIISAMVDPSTQNSKVQSVRFYSQNGHMTTVSHDNVISTSVSGDKIVIVSQDLRTKRITQYIYNANTYMMESVI